MTSRQSTFFCVSQLPGSHVPGAGLLSLLSPSDQQELWALTSALGLGQGQGQAAGEVWIHSWLLAHDGRHITGKPSRAGESGSCQEEEAPSGSEKGGAHGDLF